MHCVAQSGNQQWPSQECPECVLYVLCGIQYLLKQWMLVVCILCTSQILHVSLKVEIKWVKTLLVTKQVASMKPTTRIGVTQKLCYLLPEIWWSIIILWVGLHMELCYQRNVLKKYSQFILQIVQVHSLCEVVSGNVRSSQFVEHKVAPLAYCEIFGNIVQSFYEDIFFEIRNVCYVYY